MVRQVNSSGSSRAKNLSPSQTSTSSGFARKGSRAGGKNKHAADVRGSDRLSDSLNQANKSNHEQEEQSRSWFDQFQTPEALENMQFFVLLNSLFMILAVIPWNQILSAIKDLLEYFLMGEEKKELIEEEERTRRKSPLKNSQKSLIKVSSRKKKRRKN